MKTGWKLTIETVALTPALARRYAAKVSTWCLENETEMIEWNACAIDAKATAKWERIELPNVDEGEKL